MDTAAKNEDGAVTCTGCGTGLVEPVTATPPRESTHDNHVFFRLKVASILLVVIAGLYLLVGCISFLGAAAASQRSDLAGQVSQLVRAGFWQLIIGALCVGARLTILRGTAVSIGIATLLAATALCFSFGSWLPAIRMKLGLLGMFEPIFVFPCLAYAIACGCFLRKQKRKSD